MNGKRSEQITGGIFLIGIAVLALTRFWWPGILLVLGVTAIASGWLQGRRWQALSGGLWLIGIAALAYTGFWWPGILVLLGIMAITSGLDFSRNGPPWAGKRKREEKPKRKRDDQVTQVGDDGELAMDLDELLQESERPPR